MNGPRQVGKRTFAQKIGETRFLSQYVTLDNATQPSAVTAYPLEFLRGHPDFLIVDEVQLAPELFRPLKMVVDEGRLTQEKINGRYLLTGSANIFVIPKISEALVGRMSVLTLYPLAAFEVAGGCGDFIQRLFKRKYSPRLWKGTKIWQFS